MQSNVATIGQHRRAISFFGEDLLWPAASWISWSFLLYFGGFGFFRLRLWQEVESRTRRIPSFQIFLVIALTGFLSNFRKPLQSWLHASSCWSPRSLPGARHHRLFKNPTIKPRITTQAIPMQSMLKHALNVSVHFFNLAPDSA